MVKGWKGLFGESQMSDQDWADRAERTAVDMLNGIPAQDAVIDEEGTPTNGCYNDDFSEAEHNEANYQLLEDPDFANQTAESLETIEKVRRNWFF